MGTSALATPYLTLWLSSQGLSKREIGLINSAPFFVLMAFRLLTGGAADVMFNWRTVIIVGVSLAAVTPLTTGRPASDAPGPPYRQGGNPGA